jgi:hypothetical protein
MKIYPYIFSSILFLLYSLLGWGAFFGVVAAFAAEHLHSHKCDSYLPPVLLEERLLLLLYLPSFFSFNFLFRALGIVGCFFKPWLYCFNCCAELGFGLPSIELWCNKLPSFLLILNPQPRSHLLFINKFNLHRN